MEAERSAAPLTFDLLPFRFHFTARDSIYFPAGKSGNIVRGAFGTIFKELVCIPQCHEVRDCESRSTCPYARIFEPVAVAETGGPSGLRDWPRPFIFRAAHLDGEGFEPGSGFHFDVYLFDLKEPAIAYFVLAFAQLAREGLGPRRGRAQLTRVDQLDAAGRVAGRLYSGEKFLMTQLLPPVTLDLSEGAAPAAKVQVRFVTPTELKHGQLLATRPEFGVLFGRLRDRLSTLRALYGSGPLEVDFKALGERAEAVKMTRCALRFSDAERKSARTGERHPLGGFIGEAEYEGALGEFMPWLRAGRWVGIGRQTVWGKGVIDVKVLDA